MVVITRQRSSWVRTVSSAGTLHYMEIGRMDNLRSGIYQSTARYVYTGVDCYPSELSIIMISNYITAGFAKRVR